MDGTTLTMTVYSEITLKPKEEKKEERRRMVLVGKKFSSVSSCYESTSVSPVTAEGEHLPRRTTV